MNVKVAMRRAPRSAPSRPTASSARPSTTMARRSTGGATTTEGGARAGDALLLEHTTLAAGEGEGRWRTTGCLRRSPPRSVLALRAARGGGAQRDGAPGGGAAGAPAGGERHGVVAHPNARQLSGLGHGEAAAPLRADAGGVLRGGRRARLRGVHVRAHPAAQPSEYACFLARGFEAGAAYSGGTASGIVGNGGPGDAVGVRVCSNFSQPYLRHF